MLKRAVQIVWAAWGEAEQGLYTRLVIAGRRSAECRPIVAKLTSRRTVDGQYVTHGRSFRG